MKKFFSVILAAAMTISLASCGGADEQAAQIPQLSPDLIMPVQTVMSMTGGTMRMSDEGLEADGNGTKVTYVTEPLGAADTVSVKLEQFSDSLPVSQVWADYEGDRVQRTDVEFIQGIGEDCYIAYPFINVYDRGCYVRISAGCNNDQYQRELLINLATNAASMIEQYISAEAVQSASENIIR